MEQLHSCLRPVWLLFFAALSASPGLAQITFVKTIGTSAPNNNGTSTTIAIPTSGVGAGNSIILSFALNPGTGAVSCTDTRGNAYTVNRDVTNGSGNSGVRTVILSAHNILALTGGNAISCAHPRVSARALSATEFSGLAASAPVDQVQSATGAGSAPSSGLTAPTSQPSELLIGAIGVEGPLSDTFTPGLGYMSIGRIGTSGGNPANNITVNPEYRLVSATDRYAANGTLSANRSWAAAIVTYKAALPPATKLVITSVNGGSNITAGNDFSVVVESQTESGIPANVVSSTTISLSRKSGTGILGGTLSGTIAAGANRITITGVTYTKAESGVIITASRTSGDVLTAGDSAALMVNPGSATRLAFTVQPGSATAGSTIGGPPTLVVQDSFGNIVTNSTATIVIALGANPGGATLSGTTTKSAVAGIASFNNLNINVAGSGYTLVASSSGLTSATSSSFNVTAAGVSLVATPTAVAAGNPFTVTWAQIPNPTHEDWIGIYAPGSDNFSYLSYRYVGCNVFPTVPVAAGSCSFPIPTSFVPGTYEFRLFPNDTFDRIATSNPVIVGPPTSLNMLTVTVGPTVTAGTPGFTMTVQTQTPSGTPVNVTSDTDVIVSRLLGTGVLSGTLNGTILAGSSQISIGPVTYTKAENGVVVGVTRTSGDQLAGLNSLPFTVLPGPAAQLAFIVQPVNSFVGSSIEGPPTVQVQDNAGNAVTSTTAPINISLGNPGGASLDNNLTVTDGASVSFPALIINQAGSNYTLIASSPGIQSVTSSPFNITLSSGTGAIAGTITRVSDGTTITGATVEAFEGITLRGAALTDSSGNYSMTGLAPGSYLVRASYAGLVPQVINNVQVSNANTTSVSLSLNFGIAVQSPIAGATVNEFKVLVVGNFDTSLASEVGIKINGYVALIDGSEFATFVPINPQTTVLTAIMTDSSGNFLAGDSVPITPQLPIGSPGPTFKATPAITSVAQPVELSLSSRSGITQVQLDGNGDGTIDFVDTTLEKVTITFADTGLYFPTVYVTEAGGAVRTAIAIVQVIEQAQFDGSLQSKWTAMKDALRSGNINAALPHILIRRRSTYQDMFSSLTIPLANIDQLLTNITFVRMRGVDAEYEMNVMKGGVEYSYLVLFSIDEDGVWRIKFF